MCRRAATVPISDVRVRADLGEAVQSIAVIRTEFSDVIWQHRRTSRPAWKSAEAAARLKREPGLCGQMSQWILKNPFSDRAYRGVAAELQLALRSRSGSPAAP